tara:strand:+ start:244 stop:999 length:756 start_codon:yes stop_codon:yes gene_type:complete
MKNVEKYTTKTYRLLNGRAPLSYTIPSRNSSRSPLLWFDEDKGVNRPLRYARNQKSPFEDEQDGNAILEPVVFEDGMLTVDRSNQVLQKFLYYHPQNGNVFEEVNREVDAAEELEEARMELDAQVLAMELPMEKMITVCRVFIGNAVDRMSTPEIKRDLLMFAKTRPQELIDIINDPMLELQDTIMKFFDNNLLKFNKGNKEVWYNLKNNKKKMLNVPHNTDPYYIIGSYLQSDDGIEMFKILKKALNKDK